MTDLTPISVPFTESAEEEANRFITEVRLTRLANVLNSDQPLPQEDKEIIAELVVMIVDMFGIELPHVEADNFEDELRKVSRDLNLSRILREKALARLYILSQTTHEDGYYLYQDFINPYTNSPFTNKTDLLNWFTRDAGVSRALVYLREATYRKLAELGYGVEPAFKLIVTKPYVIKEVLNELAEWEDGALVDMTPEVAIRLAEQYLDEDEAEEIKELVQDDSPEARQEWMERIKPAIGSLVEEVAHHESAKGAMKMVREDILEKPEIIYEWNDHLEGIKIRATIRSINEAGERVIVYDEDIVVGRVDSNEEMPHVIWQDLMERLPVRGKFDLLKS